jgi:CTP:phosphocholine cytidylyltransferase-like protein
MERIMFKRKVKNFAAISMIAISLGASPANAEDKLAAPFSMISDEELVYLVEKIDPSAVSSHSQKRIKFSKEWLCGMTTEGLRNLDLNIIDFTAIEEEKVSLRQAVFVDDNNPSFRLINQSDAEAIKEEKSSYNWEVVIKSRIMLIKAAQEDLREVLIKHAELVSNYQDACKPKFQAPKVSWSDLKPIEIHSINIKKPKKGNEYV